MRVQVILRSIEVRELGSLLREIGGKHKAYASLRKVVKAGRDEAFKVLTDKGEIHPKHRPKKKGAKKK